MDEKAFLNRELSWLEFNKRVLEEALDQSVPLLERVKFLSIFSTNLDEFFMVRVARLKTRLEAGDHAPGPDGLIPEETLVAISERVHQLVEQQHDCFLDDIQPQLAAEGVRVVRPSELNEEQALFLENYFRRTLFPVLTPLAIDPGHPFPHLANRALCLIVSLSSSTPSQLPATALSVVHIPAQVVPRFIALPTPAGEFSFMLLEDVIRLHMTRLYHGYEILSCHTVRITRDAEMSLDAETPLDRNSDLLTIIEQGVRERRMSMAVRLEYDPDLPAAVLAMLVNEPALTPADLYPGEGFTAFSDLFQLYATVDLPKLKDRPLTTRACV